METLTSPNTELKIMQCGGCGIWYAIPERFHQTCYDQGGSWYCPNGCYRGYSEGNVYKQLEKEKALRKQAEYLSHKRFHAVERANERADVAERRRAAQKSATTRLKNRIKAGECPCCNSHFEQLAEHMKTQHPDYPEKL